MSFGWEKKKKRLHNGQPGIATKKENLNFSNVLVQAQRIRLFMHLEKCQHLQFPKTQSKRFYTIRP